MANSVLGMADSVLVKMVTMRCVMMPAVQVVDVVAVQ